MYSLRMSFWSVPPRRSIGHPLLLGHDQVLREDDRRRRVDGHRRGHAAEVDAVEQGAHVLDGVDGDAAAADLAERLRRVAVMAHQRGHVEGHREAGLAVVEEEAIALVGVRGAAEAGELAHRPELAPVHRLVDAARVRVLAGDTEVAVDVEPGDGVGPVARLQRQAAERVLGNGRRQPAGLGCLCHQWAPLVSALRMRSAMAYGSTPRRSPLSSAAHCALFELASRPLGGALDHDRLDLGLQPLPAAPLELAALRDGLVVTLDGVEQLVDAVAAGGRGLHDRRLPVAHPLGLAHHVAQLPDHLGGAGDVGLVDHEDVGDLEDARLEDLHAVAGNRRGDHDGGVDRLHHLELALADADGLEQAAVAAAGVDEPDRLAGGAGQAAEVAARRHAADVHAVVTGVALHAHAVAEDGAAAERARRVDGDDPDAVPGAAPALDELVADGALAAAGGPGDADDVGRAGAAADLADHLLGGGVPVLDQPDRPGEGAYVALEEAGGDVHSRRV